MNNINVTIYKGKSKKGNDFEAVRLKIGEYETLIFPKKIEMIYIKNIIEDDAHKQFKEDD